MDAVTSEISLVERSSRCAIHIFTQTRFLEVTLLYYCTIFTPPVSMPNAVIHAHYSLFGSASPQSALRAALKSGLLRVTVRSCKPSGVQSESVIRPLSMRG